MAVEQERAVHPAAAGFSMLDDEALRDLAADIKANGLNHPITLDRHGVLIDGRNRYAACTLAGVEPTFVTFEGDDDAVIDFILSENVHRRHISKGQLAMGVAMASGKKLSAARAAESAGTSKQRIVQANVVLKHAPDLAALVVSGARFLDDAYAEARRRKLAAESQAEADARALRDTNAKTERLRKHAPDLADLVAEWRLPLDEATDLLDRREAEEHLRRRRDVGYMVESTMLLRTLLYRPPSDILEDWLDGVSPHQQDGPFREDIWRPEGLRDLATSLVNLATEMERREER